MAQSNRLRPIADGDVETLFGEQPGAYPGERPRQEFPNVQPPQTNPAVENVATTMLLTSLRALSQRALIAVGNLFVLATAISAFWLWFVTMPAPSVLQLVGLALYGVLILALNWLVLRRR